MAEPKIHEVTQEELDSIDIRLEDLHNKRELNKKAIADARALGDLSENSDYDAAKAEQAVIDKDIAYYEDIKKKHRIIKAEKVEVRFIETNTTKVFELVGVLGTDPANGKISTEAPLAKAIKGKISGSIVTYKTGSGRDITVEVVRYIE